MRAYIVGGGFDGTEEYNGVYHLVTADGVTWATQWCSSFAWAMKDLYEDRSGLREDWAEKYGEVEVLRLGQDAMTLERLAAREENRVPAQKNQLPDGTYYCIIEVKDGKWDKSEPQPIEKMADLMIQTMKDSVK